MSKDKLLVEHTDDIVRLTLNRPEAGNAIDLDLARALLAAAIACDEDQTVRCVVLTGAGRLFCAGGDVALFQAAGEGLPALVAELADTLHRAVARLARMRKPLVVLVNGTAAGAGLSLVLLGDLVLASRTAGFAAAYGAIGLSPDGGMSWLLPRLVGLRKAQDIILGGRRITAEEAKAWGLVTRMVEPDALETDGAALAERLAALSTPALSAARALLLQSLGASLEAHLDHEARSITALSAGPEAREGIAAFAQKRKPDFKGARHG